MTLGQKIIKLRKENKLSQEKLAEKLKITRQTLSNYENELTIPDLDNANKIANYFNISLDELTGNNLTFIESKLNNNEKLVKKNIKYQKILLITIYFIILTFLIIVMIYYWNKKDFTTKYQTDFTCYKKEKEYTEYMRLVLDEQSYSCMDEVDGKICNYDNTSCTYSCDESKKLYYYTFNTYGKYVYRNGEEKSGEPETMLAGYSLKDAVDSMDMAKKLLLEQGYICK